MISQNHFPPNQKRGGAFFGAAKPFPRTLPLILWLIACLLAGLPSAAQAQPDSARAWTGGMGLQVSVAELMARQALLESGPVGLNPVELPALRPGNFGPAGSFAPAAVQFPPAAESGAALAALPQAVGTHFVGVTYNQSFFVPPDTQGAVGPTQYLVKVNGYLRTFNKASGTADGALALTTNAFVPISIRGANSVGDVMVRYDRTSGRWILTLETFTASNVVVIAVSSGPVITSTSSFTFFSFVQDTVTPVGSDAGCFFDYPATGIDANALYIGGNIFCGNTYNGSALFVVQKSSVLGAGPLVVKVFRGLNNLGQPQIGTPRGVDNWDAAPPYGYVVGASTYGVLRLLQVAGTSAPDWTAAAPTLAGNPLVSGTALTADPLPVEHLGNNHPGGTYDGKLDASDIRMMPSVVRGGQLWTSHGTLANSSGMGSPLGDRDAARWYQIGAIDTDSPAVVQMGTIYDPAAANPLNYTYPTINASYQGHAVIGMTQVGALSYANAAVAGRLAGDPLGSMSAVEVFYAGDSAYTGTFDTGSNRAGVRRWGDYSATVLDPCDDMTLWTAQEFTQANVWAVGVAQLKAPPPAAPSLAAPAGVALGQASLNVTISGVSSGGSGFFDTPNTNPDACRLRISAAVSGGVVVNSVTYSDPTHVTLNISTLAAAPGLQTVTITNPDGQSAAAAVLTVLAGADTVTSVTSELNPSTYGQSVTFSAAVSAAAGIPDGSLTFSIDGTPLAPLALDAQGKAAYTSAGLAAGNHLVEASYAGTPVYAASSGTLAGGQVVKKAPASVTLTGLAQVYNNSPRPAGANTTPPGLLVSFDYSPLPGAPTAAGSYPVTATITETNYAGSASGLLVISPAASAVQLTSSLNPGLAGQIVTFTATVSSTPGLPVPPGTVVFSIAGVPQPAAALDVNGKALLVTAGLPVGSSQVSASYPGSANYAPAGPAALDQLIRYGVYLPFIR